MKKRILLSCLVALFAVLILESAESWDKKPFQQWSDKDVDHVLHNSPWSKQVTVSLGMQSSSGDMGGGRGRRSGGGGGGGGEMGGGGAGGGTGMSGGGGGGGDMAGGGGGGMGRSGGGGGMDTMDSGARSQAINAVIRWQSALPVKQATAKVKYGNEADSMPEVKQLLAREEPNYIIGLTGLPPMGLRGGGDPARMQKALESATTLAVKGKEPLHPSAIQAQPENKLMSVYFVFPKTTPIVLEDKEVEFSTKVGTLEFKKKFKLQDMVYAGKLEL